MKGKNYIIYIKNKNKGLFWIEENGEIFLSGKKIGKNKKLAKIFKKLLFINTI